MNKLVPYIPESAKKREKFDKALSSDHIENGRVVCLCLLKMDSNESTKFWSALKTQDPSVHASFTNWNECE